MSFANPTPLRIGASGTLNGWRVRVAGRVVLGVTLDGETYYWNEYHLVDDAGQSATLVFEETEAGPEWKLFRAIEPLYPMDAREAATKNVGDMVNLDGKPVPVTLTGTSRVYHIEGQAPEGVEVGDVASYFNADTGIRMLVASWTGHEIEFYEGLDVPAASLASAFGLPPGAFPAAGFSTGPANASGSAATTKTFTRIVLAVLGMFSLVGARTCFSSSSGDRIAAGPRPKAAAPPLRLADGASGVLGQQHYIVSAHAVVEVARVSGRHDRREYLLRDEADHEVLLVNGLSGGSREWHLLRPLSPAAPLTPHDAATRKVGFAVGVDGRPAHLIDLYQSTARSADGNRAAELLPGVVQYGFVARDGTQWVIARWNENRIRWYRGISIPDADVLSAFDGAK